MTAEAKSLALLPCALWQCRRVALTGSVGQQGGVSSRCPTEAEAWSGYVPPEMGRVELGALGPLLDSRLLLCQAMRSEDGRGNGRKGTDFRDLCRSRAHRLERWKWHHRST